MSGWTDYLPDWSSPDALRLGSEQTALEALTAAVRERASVVDPYGLPGLPELSPLISARDFAVALQSYLRVLLRRFVNSTDVDGAPVPTANRLPLWTEADMAAALELDGLTDVTGIVPFRDWLHEQYRIVNRLRRLAMPMEALTEENEGAAWLHSWYGDGTFEGVNAAFIEGNGPGGPGALYPYPHLVSFDYADRNPYIDSGVCRFGGTWENPYDFACGLAVFAQAVKCPKRADNRPAARTFLPIPPFLEENVWYDITAQCEIDGTSAKTAILLRPDCAGYNQDVMTMPRYAGIAILPSEADGSYSGVFLTVRFDVAGGFTFGDWEEAG